MDATRRRSLMRYALLQLPDVGLASLAVFALWTWFDLPGWMAVLALLAWLAKDVVMYPFVRRAFELGDGPFVGVHRVVGARGVVAQSLEPRGWVRVGGELWRAELETTGAPVPLGARVRVRELRGMTLLVEPEQPPEFPAALPPGETRH